MSSAIDTSAASPFASARARSAAPSSCASARRPNTSSRSTSPRFSARTPSTTSVASAARCSAAPFTWAAHWRSRSGRSAAAINSLIARMPLSGVRISWASMASAVSVAPDRAGRARFLRRCLADFALLALRITHPSPPTGCHARADKANQRKLPCRILGRTVAGQRRLFQPDDAPDIGRRLPLLTQFAQRGRARRLGQLLALGIEDQPVVMIERRREARAAPAARDARWSPGRGPARAPRG